MEHLEERPSAAPLAADVADLQEGLATLNSVVGAIAKFSVEESEANAQIHQAFRGAFAALSALPDVIDDLSTRVQRLEAEMALPPLGVPRPWWRRLFG